MALIPAADINTALDPAATLRKPKVVKQMVFGSSTAALYVEAWDEKPGKCGWIYNATASNTATAAVSVTAAIAAL